ncbi:DUF6197 family protein [Aquisediminimonas profunda]|uniref:DUF6197 family protein n=1 Tax=Aquisediminimonas profunda TaxID=1550733 RepID=UPI003CCEBE67
MSVSHTRQILIDARALISDPAHWATGTMAKDDYGDNVPGMAQDACRFCATGAVRRALLASRPITLTLEQPEQACRRNAAKIFGHVLTSLRSKDSAESTRPPR